MRPKIIFKFIFASVHISPPHNVHISGTIGWEGRTYVPPYPRRESLRSCSEVIVFQTFINYNFSDTTIEGKLFFKLNFDVNLDIIILPDLFILLCKADLLVHVEIHDMFGEEVDRDGVKAVFPETGVPASHLKMKR